MINRIMFAFLFVLLGFKDAYTQELRLDSVADNCFSGLMSSTITDITYTCYIADEANKKNASLTVLYTNGAMLESKKVKTDVSKTTVIQGAAYSGNGFAFSLADASDNSRTLLIIDFEGKVLYKNTETKVDKELLTTDSRVYMYDCMPEGIVVLKAKSAKKDSYLLTNYNIQFKQVWTKDIKEEHGGVVDIIAVKQTMENLYILKKETIGAKQNNKYEYSITCINTLEGKEAYTKVLKDGSDYIFPVFIRVGDLGLYTAGMYYKDGKYAEGKPQGLMLLHYDLSGNVSATKIPISRLNSFLPDAIVSTITDGGIILIEDAFQDMVGNYAIIGEMVSKKMESSKEAEVKISDLMVIKLNEEKDVAKLSIVEGVKENELQIKGPFAMANTLSLAEWLHNNNLMNYKFTTVTGSQNVCYTTRFVDDKMKFSMTSVDSPVEFYTTDILINRLEDPDNKMKLPKKIIIDLSAPKGTRLKQWNYTGVYLGMGDRMKIYNCLPPKLLIAGEWLIQGRK